ncbi:hypothetical protein [Cohnella mopanensis]|uniref:hypothetical protein n=1 Tax=Cohnella mopanensis TaxID=2911966 RepID=UPI001EF82A80|nr:hypothetical protein [Cohnella mopanensis]
MTATMAYSLQYYLRSYRYVAPLLIFSLTLFFIYSIVPNPVMPSYSLTSTFLFVVSAWLAFGYIDVEDGTQQQITVMHTGSLSKYYYGKLLVIVIIVNILSIICVLYPILFNKFDRQPSLSEWVIALLSHSILSILGIALSILFTNKWVQKLSYAILGIFLAIALSLAGAGIENSSPHSIKALSWLIPPVFRTMDMLNNYEETAYSGVVVSLISPLVYSGLLFWLFLIKMKRKLV